MLTPEQTSVKFSSIYKTCHSWKVIWKYCLWNGCHFIVGEMNWQRNHWKYIHFFTQIKDSMHLPPIQVVAGFLSSPCNVMLHCHVIEWIHHGFTSTMRARTADSSHYTPGNITDNNFNIRINILKGSCFKTFVLVSMVLTGLVSEYLPQVLPKSSDIWGYGWNLITIK